MLLRVVTLGINSRKESIDYINIVLYGDVTIGAYVDDRGIMHGQGFFQNQQVAFSIYNSISRNFSA